MISKKKFLSAILAISIVAAMAIGGTIAYLTSTDAVNNTFSVGKVKITMDEAKVSDMGVADTTVDRVKANQYKLMPDHEYVKDPTIHVEKGSEACWLFVKVEDGLAAIEAAPTIADQITSTTNGWTALGGTGNEGVYYKEQASLVGATNNADVPVFQKFKLMDNADVTKDDNKDGVADITTAKIKVTAYAIQKDGLADATVAWAALNS
jgi:predicted ribosomally synthesized peptide with SipW-like signal peptide